MTRYGSLAVFLLLVIAAAAISGSFEAGEWYFQKLNKPSWTPPTWAFGPIWAIVYVLSALAAWNVWLTGHYSRLNVLAWWGVLLVLNVGWSALFFGFHRPGWAWLLLGLTIVIALFCIKAFRSLSRQAAYLMLPYLLWIGFTWVFNLAAWTLNGGLFMRLLNG